MDVRITVSAKEAATVEDEVAGAYAQLSALLGVLPVDIVFAATSGNLAASIVAQQLIGMWQVALFQYGRRGAPLPSRGRP